MVLLAAMCFLRCQLQQASHACRSLEVARLVGARHWASSASARAQVRGIACQHPNSLTYVAGAPSHEQRESESDPWVKMEAGFSVRHHIQPMRDIVDQCDVPPENMVSALSPHPDAGVGALWADSAALCNRPVRLTVWVGAACLVA